jgi:hypothetical protein
MDDQSTGDDEAAALLNEEAILERELFRRIPSVRN